MKIGIDIDDTISNTWDCLIPYLMDYFKVSREQLTNYNGIYYEACNCTREEYYSFARKYYDKVYMDFKIKENVSKVIKKLKEEGNEIIIITARSTNGFTDPYQASKHYLDENGILFDKMFVNVNDKGKLCKEEGIDILIDDSIKNCTSAINNGIKVLMFETSFNKNNNDFEKVRSWDEIYSKLKG